MSAAEPVAREESVASGAPEIIEHSTHKPNSKESLSALIETLRKEQQDVKTKKVRLQKDLRNAMRKKQRLTERARKLSDDDLLSVLAMRQNNRSKASNGNSDAGASRPAKDGASTSSRDADA